MQPFPSHLIPATDPPASQHESIVLLQNKAWANVRTGVGLGAAPLLPLSLEGLRRIAVIGPSADVMRLGDYSGGGIHERFVTVLQVGGGCPYLRVGAFVDGDKE